MESNQVSVLPNRPSNKIEHRVSIMISVFTKIVFHIHPQPPMYIPLKKEFHHLGIINIFQKILTQGQSFKALTTISSALSHWGQFTLSLQFLFDHQTTLRMRWCKHLKIINFISEVNSEKNMTHLGSINFKLLSKFFSLY